MRQMESSRTEASLAKSAKRAEKQSAAWSFAGTLDMAVFDASQGCGSSGGIVNSTELFKKLFLDRQDYQQSSLNSVDIASFSSPRHTLRGANLLPVNGFIHAGTAVLKTSLEAWLLMPGLSLTWTKIVGAFRGSDFFMNFMGQSVLEKDAQQQQHISTPNIRVDHIGNSASQANRGGGGQNKRNIARSEDGPCGGRAEADGEVPGGAAAGSGSTGGVSADRASPGGSGGRGGGVGGAERATGDGGTAADGAPRSPPGRGLPTRPPGGACRRRPFRRDHHRARRPERTTASRAGMPSPEAAGAGHARALTAALHRSRCRHRRSRAPRRPPLHRGLRFRPATPHRPIHRRSAPPPPRRRQAPPRPPRRVRRMARLRNRDVLLARAARRRRLRVQCFFCAARRPPGSVQRRYFRCDRRGCSGSRCAAAAGRLSPGRSAP